MSRRHRTLARVLVLITPLAAAVSTAGLAQDQTTTGAPDQPMGSRGVIVLHPKPADATTTPVATPVPAPVVKACDRPFAKPDIVLARSAHFHSALQGRLARKSGPVVVSLARPFPVGGSTPAELVPWLNEVKASGGLVSVDTYCQDSRGFMAMLRSLFGKPAGPSFAAVDGYDAVLHVDGLDGVVTQVEFRPRSAS
jgi:hypothetical protein